MAETTTDEILSAINNFASKVEDRFDGIDKRFDGIDKRFDGLDARVDGLDARVGRLENQMVTKDYLDSKLADLRGDFVMAIRREDEKVEVLVGKLQKENSLSAVSAQAVLKIKPLARI